MPPPVGGDRTEPVDIQQEMQRSYIDYAMSVIVGRALPPVEDGLKPVHRRVLYSMGRTVSAPTAATSSARAVGEVMGNYHPHGDRLDLRRARPAGRAVVAALPADRRSGQLRLPRQRLPAAMRYTECRLSPLAMAMLQDIDEETVDFSENYDGKTQEPDAAVPGAQTC